jgi:hypothetical protein
MPIFARLAMAALLVLAAADGSVAQTLTVNKVQETLSGQPLDSTNVSIAIPIAYVITITSSDANKNPSITVTDTLPAGFALLDISCTAQNGAQCPNGGSSQTGILFSGNPVVVSGLLVPAGGATSVEIRMTG